MNIWSQVTLERVRKSNYLDELQKIYTHEEGERTISKSTLVEIENLFESGDAGELLDKLLSLEKFPYKDSYVGFLRKDRTSIERNPETVLRIYQHLQKIGIEGIIKGITQAKEANTRRGSQFSKWIASNYPTVNEQNFKKSTTGIVLLEGSEETVLKFCNNELKLGITKRPDLLIKSGKIYVVGEAKFLSSLGGNQGRAFDDGMKLATLATGHAYKIFILDGIIWLEEGSEQFKQIQNSNAYVISAVLLHDYLINLEIGQ